MPDRCAVLSVDPLASLGEVVHNSSPSFCEVIFRTQSDRPLANCTVPHRMVVIVARILRRFHHRSICTLSTHQREMAAIAVVGGSTIQDSPGSLAISSLGISSNLLVVRSLSIGSNWDAHTVVPSTATGATYASVSTGAVRSSAERVPWGGYDAR